MSKRLNSPDTDADAVIQACIQATPPQPFIVRAGAGSGKTTSLVKALGRVLEAHGSGMRRRKQQVACITYTELAAHEISVDVNENPLVHVSTIHSFYWSIIKSFQADIKAWVRRRIDAKLSELRAAADAFTAKTKQTTRDKNTRDIARYEAQSEGVALVTIFSYGMGSDYKKGILGHDDILNVANFLMHERPLFRRLVALRFPFVFIDESQDAMNDVVESFRRVETEMRGQFCLGFFGDPMQKIYLTGIGAITPAEHWREIDKPENYRCATRVLNVANAIRAKGDGLQQVGGRTEEVDGIRQRVEGTARLFVLPASMERRDALTRVRNWTAQTNQDESWLEGARGSAKVLVIVHRMAANRLGFGGLYAAMNDGASDSLKQGFQDGTAWPLRPFLSFLMPLVSHMRSRNEFEAMNLLRAHSPRLTRDALKGADAANVLRELRAAVLRLMELMADRGGTVRDVLIHVQVTGLMSLDDRFTRRLDAGVSDPAAPAGDDAAGAVTGENDGDAGTDGEAAQRRKSDDGPVSAYFQCAAAEFWPFQTYLNEESAFATQHGVKGDEFDRVMVVMDDSESDFKLYSFEKYFGIVPPSKTDLDNLNKGQDNALSRTGRLLYVCCTRAKRDLVLVLFTDDVAAGRENVLNTGIFGAEFVLGPEVLRAAEA